MFWQRPRETGAFCLAHQNRTIAIASDFRVDGGKSPEIPQKEGVLGSEIAARNRRSLATFHRTLKSQCIIAVACLGNRAISGVRDGHRNRKSQKSLRFRCAKAFWHYIYNFKAMFHVCLGNGKLNTTSFCTNSLNAPRNPAHPSKIPGTSQVPSLKPKANKLSSEGTNFWTPTPSRHKTPALPSGLRPQKVNLCALFSCLNVMS